MLGAFEVVAADGRTVEVGGPKQRAVLAMLCLEVGHVVPLDRMINDLWDEPPASAAATIQSYVSNLRRALEPDRPPRTPSTLLVSRAPGYLLDVAPEHIDAVRFHRTVERAREILPGDPATARLLLDEALSIWRGPALADFTYESFALADVQRLEELRLAALEDRIDADVRLGRHVAVVGELEALVRDHPLRERLWGQLMIALYRSGRQGDALRAYHRCVDLLAEELGLLPSPALRRLEDQILNQDPDLDPDRAERSDPRPAPAEVIRPLAAGRTEEGTGSQLAGRSSELAVVRDAIDQALAGSGTLVFIEGEPGAGKSRLLDEAVRCARELGLAAAVARCFEVGETPPFWPFVQAARALGGQLSAATMTDAAGGYLAELTPLFPELGVEHATHHALSPHRVADAMVHALSTLTASTPIIIGIDDLHAADPDSVTMLVALAQGLEHLGDVVAALVRLPHVHRIELAPLGVDDIAHLITDVTGCEVDRATAAAVQERTDGNAFYTVELARLLSANGLLGPNHDRWSGMVPTTIRDVVRQRLTRMPEGTLQALRVASVIGRSFDVDVVAEVTGADVDALLDEIDLAVACGTIAEGDRPGRFRFTHVLVRDTIAAALNSLRQARLHGRIADAIESLHGTEPGAASDVAFHRIEARSVIGVGRALDALLTAAAGAASTGALAGAESMHRRRIALAAELPDAGDRIAQEQQALIDLTEVIVAHRGYQSDDLGPIHHRLQQLAEGSSPEIAVQTAIGRFVFHITRGELDEADAAHARLSAMLVDAPGPMPRLIVEHSGGILALHHGTVGRALERFDMCEDWLAIVDPGDSGTVVYPGLGQSVVVSHTNFSSVGQWLAGDTVTSNSTLDRGEAAARRGKVPYSIAFALTFRAYLAAMRHDVDRAALESGRAAAVCDEHGFGFLASMVAVAEAWSCAAQGDAAVVDTLHSIDALLVKGQTGGFFTVSWGLIADAHRRLGRVDAAREVLGRALEFSARGGEMIWRPELERLWWLLDDQDDDTGPLRRAAAMAERLGLVALRRRCEATLAEQP